MRVTNSMMVSNYLNNLNNSMNRMTNLQGQLSSNRKYMHISDDPIGVIYSQQARSKLHQLSIYQDNVKTGRQWLTQTETSLIEFNNLIQAAYEQAVDAATDVENSGDRQKVAEYVGQLRDQVLTALNSTYGDKYIFGGYNTTGYVDGTSRQLVTPFGYEEEYTLIDDLLPDTEDNRAYTGFRKLTYNGIDVMSTDPDDQKKLVAIAADQVTLDIGAGSRMQVSYNGVDVMNFKQDDGTALNIYNLFDRLTVALQAEGSTAEDIDKYIKPMQDAQGHVLSITAELGGKTNRLDLMETRYEQDFLNYTQMKSDAEDADQAEIIMYYKMAEAVYQAALATGSYVIQPTLMDFLR